MDGAGVEEDRLVADPPQQRHHLVVQVGQIGTVVQLLVGGSVEPDLDHDDPLSEFRRSLDVERSASASTVSPVIGVGMGQGPIQRGPSDLPVASAGMVA